MDHLEILLENQGYTEEICEWRGLKKELEKETKLRKEQLRETESIKEECCFDREQNMTIKKVLKSRITELTEANKMLMQKFQEEVAAREINEVKLEKLEKDKKQEAKEIMKQLEKQPENHPNIHRMITEKPCEVRFSDAVLGRF